MFTLYVQKSIFYYAKEHTIYCIVISFGNFNIKAIKIKTLVPNDEVQRIVRKTIDCQLITYHCIFYVVSYEDSYDLYLLKCWKNGGSKYINDFEMLKYIINHRRTIDDNHYFSQHIISNVNYFQNNELKKFIISHCRK